MILDFLKNLWTSFKNSEPRGSYIVSTRLAEPIIVLGGEPLSTVIVEGAGVVDIKDQTPSSLDN